MKRMSILIFCPFITGVVNINVGNAGEYVDCPAGKYLAVDADKNSKCVVCPTGSYCPGVFDVSNLENPINIGMFTCPDEYSLSDLGAESENQCYKKCSPDKIEHAITIEGYEYIDGTNNCSVTKCNDGYHIFGGVDLNQTIDTANGVVLAWTDDGLHNNIQNADVYGLTENMQWAVDFGGRGTVRGMGLCSTKSGIGIANGAKTPEQITKYDNLVDETGQDGAVYCYCNVVGYTESNNIDRRLISPWVFRYNIGDVGNCGFKCANFCANYVSSNTTYKVFRTALFASVPIDNAICQANSININWKDVDNDFAVVSTCVYGQNLYTPSNAPKKKGYTFVGWTTGK